MRLGEADRIVTLMSAGRGKIRAVAKGVRKTKSRFGGRLEPMTHVAALLYEGVPHTAFNASSEPAEMIYFDFWEPYLEAA